MTVLPAFHRKLITALEGAGDLDAVRLVVTQARFQVQMAPMAGARLSALWEAIRPHLSESRRDWLDTVLAEEPPA